MFLFLQGMTNNVGFTSNVGDTILRFTIRARQLELAALNILFNVVNSWFIFCICNGGIYHVKLKSLVQRHFLVCHQYTYIFFIINFSYIGSFFS